MSEQNTSDPFLFESDAPNERRISRGRREVEAEEAENSRPIRRRRERRPFWTPLKIGLASAAALVLVTTVLFAARSSRSGRERTPIAQSRDEGHRWGYPQLIEHLNTRGLKITARQDTAPHVGEISDGLVLSSGRGAVYCEHFPNERALVEKAMVFREFGGYVLIWGLFVFQADTEAKNVIEEIATRLNGCVLYYGKTKIFPR